MQVCTHIHVADHAYAYMCIACMHMGIQPWARACERICMWLGLVYQYSIDQHDQLVEITCESDKAYA